MKRNVCFLPSAFMLAMYPVKHWIGRFREFTRRSPTEIVLPAIGLNGPSYDSAVHTFPGHLTRDYLLPHWIREAREELGENGVVWVSINPTLSFLNNEALWLRNQYIDDLPEACLNNAVVQSVIHDFIQELADLGGIDGVTLDATDAYPNSGASGYEGVMCYCFCDFCRRDLSEAGFKEPPSVFVGAEGLQRLVLHIDPDGSGTAHIDPPQRWIDQRDVSSLVSFAIARRFVEAPRTELEPEAARLFKYLDARTRVTAGAIRSALVKAKECELRSAVVLGSSSMDMSQMVTLDVLDRVKAADEYWLPDAPDRSALEGNWQALQFLSPRSTYYQNNFFETVEDADDRAITLGPERFLQLLMNQSKSLRGNKLTAGAAYVVEKLDQYSSLVGVPLGGDDHLAIISRLSTEVTGTVLPPEILDAFRIGNPDHSPPRPPAPPEADQ